MSLVQSFIQILDGHEAKAVRRLDPTHFVWRIERPGFFARTEQQLVHACQYDLFRTLLDSESSIFIHHEDPCENDVPGVWSEVGDSVWLIPSDWPIENRDSQSWLDLGNWLIYPAPLPIQGRIPDIARSDAAAIIDFLDEFHLELVIHSFHDNTLWTVATYVA